MAEVTGRIGDNDVSLDNAASETTLRALLLATTKSSKEMDRLLKLAAKAGMNPKDIEAANQALKEIAKNTEKNTEETKGSSKSFGALSKSVFVAGVAFGHFSDSAVKTVKNLGNFADTLISGQASISGMFKAFENLPLGLGLLASVIGKVTKLQEESFETYKQLTSAGINFAGNLNEIRETAAGLGLTLDQFSGLMTKNSEAITQMGNGATDGAKNFVRLGRALRESDVGKQLHTLGFGFEEMNQGVINYIKATGGRTSAEMKNTKGLTESAGEYMKQLDMLAAITGKSRESQEEALKEAEQEAAYQAYLLTLDEDGRAKANEAMKNAMQVGGKGAVQALQSQFLGLPPMTKAAQDFTALMPSASAGVAKMGDAVSDTTKKIGDVRNAFAEAMIGSANDARAMGKDFIGALSMSGSGLAETLNIALKNSNLLQNKNIQTADDMKAHIDQILKDQADRSKSTAAEAAAASLRMKELGDNLTKALIPALERMSPVILDLTNRFANFVTKYMPEIEAAFSSAANMLGDFVSNLFSSEGRAKIMNDLSYLFKSLMITIREKIDPTFSKEDAATARKELDLEKTVFDGKAAEARLREQHAAELNALNLQANTAEKEKLMFEFNKAVREKEQLDKLKAQGKTLSLEQSRYLHEQTDFIKKNQKTVDMLNSGDFTKAHDALGEIFKVGGKTVAASKELDTMRRVSEKELEGVEAQGAAQSGSTGVITRERQVDTNPYKENSANWKRWENNKNRTNQKLPKASDGGIFDGPVTGYPVMLHGNEAVVPLDGGLGTKSPLQDLMSKLPGMNSGKDLTTQLKEFTSSITEAITGLTATKSENPNTTNDPTKTLIEEVKQLNKQTAEMLEHIKISAEFDRRNLDALNDMSNNSFIRA
jgi:hypothetical protein